LYTAAVAQVCNNQPALVLMGYLTWASKDPHCRAPGPRLGEQLQQLEVTVKIWRGSFRIQGHAADEGSPSGCASHMVSIVKGVLPRKA
jgi:hypothetical protein